MSKKIAEGSWVFQAVSIKSLLKKEMCVCGGGGILYTWQNNLLLVIVTNSKLEKNNSVKQ